jgi:hypothetical protein
MCACVGSRIVIKVGTYYYHYETFDFVKGV